MAFGFASGYAPKFSPPTPEEIGYFGLNGDRKFLPDRSQMKYYVEPTFRTGLSMDLNIGYASAVRYEAVDTKKIFDQLLHWLVLNQQRLATKFPARVSKEKFGADFVMRRGILTEILCTPYTTLGDGWLFYASKFKGTIYLFASDNSSNFSRNRIESYWGKKFEQYVSSDTKNGKPNAESPLNENEEFRIVVKTAINENIVLCSAEVDAADPSVSEGSCARYVEFKTSKIYQASFMWSFFKHKLIRWWAQCVTVGIEKVVCGFRTSTGIVEQVKTFKTSEMPSLAMGLWSPESAWNYCDRFLNLVKKYIKKDDPKLGSDFVMSGGILRDILSASFTRRGDGWLFYASKFKGTIYMFTCDDEEFENIVSQSKKFQRCGSQTKEAYWGKKFEQYMTSDTKDGKPNVESPLNENEQFRIIVKTIINGNVILCCAEVDGVDPSVETFNESCARYVELRTSKIDPTGQNWVLYNYKLPKAWAQCVAIGIEKIVCGFRNSKGIVKEIKTFKTAEIPSLAKQSWNPKEAWNFCLKCLDDIKKGVKKDDSRVVYKFSWKPGQRSVKCEELFDNKENKNVFRVLPVWFTDEF